MSDEDRETIRRLLSYLPFFERPGLEIGGARAEWENGVLHIYPAEYTDETHGFFSLLAPPFINSEYVPEQVYRWLQNPTFIENASPQQLRSVLTWLCRGERFCSGFWTDQFNNGNLVRALRRLQSLQDSDFRYDTSASVRAEEEADAITIPEPEVITVYAVDPYGNPLTPQHAEKVMTQEDSKGEMG